MYRILTGRPIIAELTPSMPRPSQRHIYAFAMLQKLRI